MGEWEEDRWMEEKVLWLCKRVGVEIQRRVL